MTTTRRPWADLLPTPSTAAAAPTTRADDDQPVTVQGPTGPITFPTRDAALAWGHAMTTRRRSARVHTAGYIISTR